MGGKGDEAGDPPLLSIHLSFGPFSFVHSSRRFSRGPILLPLPLPLPFAPLPLLLPPSLTLFQNPTTDLSERRRSGASLLLPGAAGPGSG
jgi:hypothetical protein